MNKNELEDLKGVLPMSITDDEENKNVIEVIFCSSIAGYDINKNEMPKFLFLTKIAKDGREYNQKYVQAVN